MFVLCMHYDDAIAHKTKSFLSRSRGLWIVVAVAWDLEIVA